MCKIEKKKGLGKEIMTIPSLKTLEHTVICTHTHIQKYTIGQDPETARLTTQNYEVRAKGTGLENSFTLITGRYYPLDVVYFGVYTRGTVSLALLEATLGLLFRDVVQLQSLR